MDGEPADGVSSPRVQQLQGGTFASEVAVESLDFDDPQSQLLEAEHRAHGPRRVPGSVRWPLLVLTGAGTGFLAFLIKLMVELVSGLRWKLVDSLMADDSHPDSHDIPYPLPCVVFVLVNGLLAALAAGLVLLEPVAEGSGIPAVKCYLNGVRMPRLLKARAVVAKCFGIVFSVSSCLPLGKEGPMVHAGSGMGALFSADEWHWARLAGPLRSRSELLRREFVTAGSAAGVAAAFGAPIGGVLFAVEEGCSFWNVRLATQIFVATSSAVLVLNACQKLHDPGAPASGLTNFGTLGHRYSLWEIPLMVVIGIAGGLLGALYNWMNYGLARWRKAHIVGRPARRVTEVLVISVLTSLTLYTLAARAYHCEPLTKLDWMNNQQHQEQDGWVGRQALQYGCPEGHYNDMATYFFTQMETSLGHLFHAEVSVYSSTLVLHLVPYFLLFVVTYGTGVPSGIFLPCLLVGANLGRLYGELLATTGVDVAPGLYAFLGAASFLAGVSRLTVSLAAILMESTANTEYVVPLLIVSWLAKTVGDVFNAGLYDIYIELQGLPFLTDTAERHGGVLAQARTIMNADPAKLPLALPPCELSKLLRARPRHNIWLVCDPAGRLRGTVARRDLIAIIGNQAFGSRKILFRDLLGWKETDRVAAVSPSAPVVDISWYMDRAPVVVWPNAPLARVHRIMRELGLRHIVVQDPDTGRPLGVITRKDILAAYAMPTPATPSTRPRRHEYARDHGSECSDSMSRPLSSDARQPGEQEEMTVLSRLPTNLTQGEEIGAV